MSRDDTRVDRRSFLKAAGGAAVTASVAGCLGDGGGDSGDGGDGGDSGDSGDGGGTTTGDGTTTAGGPSGTLIYTRGDHPENYDPQQTTSGEVAKVTNQIFDPLIQFKPGSGGQLQDALATEYSLEGTTATATIRDGATFHNGDDVTAGDVRATIRRFTDGDYEYYLGDENRSGYGPFTFGNWVESVEGSGKEVTFNLTQQYAPFLRNLAMFAAVILSQSQIESMGSSPDAQASLGTEPVGAGPFEFAQLDNSNQRVRLTANTDYYGTGPNVGEVVFTTNQQNSTRANAVINGDAHITDNLDSQSSQSLQSAGSARLVSKNGINTGYMAFNMARVEQFRNKKVRQAFNYAVNTKAIVNQIYQGFATQADQPLPPDVLGHNESLSAYPTDKEKAQSLLEEAGVEPFTFELATFSNPRGYNPSPIDTANQFKTDLEDIGFTVNINQFSTFSSYLDYTDAGNHDACFLGWYTDNADPDNFMYVLLDPKNEMSAIPEGQDWVSWDTLASTLDVSAWANTEYMQLVREAQRTYDQATREENYKQAAQIAHEECPWVFIDYAQTLRGVNSNVVDIESYQVSSVGGPYLNLVELNQ